MSVFNVYSNANDVEAIMDAVGTNLHQWEKGESTLELSPTQSCSSQETRPPWLVWRIDRNAIIHSTRPRLGPWIIRFQMLVRRLTWWFLEPILQQIELFQMNTALFLEKGLANERIVGKLGNLEELTVEMLQQGTPIPSGELINLVGGNPDVPWFLIGGALAAKNMANVLEKNGVSIDDFEAILDFGCGCGRVIRHWKRLKNSKLYGTDYNSRLIEWCRQNIDFAEFSVNDLSPPTSYGDATFDFIYVFSVFTHLPEALQISWISELARLLRPGGFLFITTHGKYYLPQLPPSERDQFLQGQLVVLNEEQSGTNICGAFHPEQYVRDVLAKGFTVTEFIPQGAKGNRYQDIFLLKKL